MFLSKTASAPSAKPQRGSASPGRRRLAEGEDSSGYSVTLPVDTLNMTMKGGSCSMLTLQVTLLDLSESGAQYCLGDGGMQTATLYYQALRAASASPPASQSGAGEPIGVSPWMTVETPIYDRVKHLPVAWVTLSSQYVMEGISPQVASALQDARSSTAPEDRTGGMEEGTGRGRSMALETIMDDEDELHIIEPASSPGRGGRGGGAGRGGKDNSVSAERARIELGLKQAFSAADKDQSGSISVEEVCHSIRK